MTTTTITRPFTVPEFRAALGSFVTGVTIVACRDLDGRPVGLTANSFNSVSLEPPLVLWSLGHSSSAMTAMSRGTHYAVNVLASHQQALAERFARTGIDRFRDVAWHEGAGGAPVLDDAAAVFECVHRSRHVEGDHTIFVGQVEHLRLQCDARPLIFHRGRFHTAWRDGEPAAQEAAR